MTKLRPGFRMWTITCEKNPFLIPRFVRNSLKKVAVSVEDEIMLKHLLDIFRERIIKVDLIGLECTFKKEIDLKNIEYFNMENSSFRLRVPWVGPTLLNSLSTLHTLKLSNISLELPNNLDPNLELPKLKYLQIYDSSVSQTLFSIAMPMLKKLDFGGVLTVRPPGGALPRLGAGYSKLEYLCVINTTGDMITLLEEIVIRSKSTLQSLILDSRLTNNINDYFISDHVFIELRYFALKYIEVTDKFFQMKCPVLKVLEMTYASFPELTHVNVPEIITHVSPCFTGIEKVILICCNVGVVQAMKNICKNASVHDLMTQY